MIGLAKRLVLGLAPRARRRLAGWLSEGLPMEERAFLVEALLAQPVTVQTPHGAIHFLNHGRASCKRARTLLTKEPQSLAWIDALPAGSVYWDVGANVGALSLYAARRGDLQVWAFEPAAVNYYNLAANCELNGLQDRMHCLLAGLGEGNRLARIEASQTAPARSFSFTSKRPELPPASQTAAVHSIDSLVEEQGLPEPTLLKIDVPGMTLDILQGAERTLARPALRQVQVEARENGAGGRRVVELLRRHGFEVVARGSKKNGTRQGDLLFARS